MNYTKVDFSIKPHKPWNEILIDQLAEIGFDSFTEENNKLQAYIPSSEYSLSEVEKIINRINDSVDSVSYETEEIPDQNWNAKWESDFDPVEVDNEVIIYAPFHDIDKNKYTYAVEIKPQMSFGTGHHQTTYLLCKALLAQNINKKAVLDVGTGTGVLGILAAKMGAQDVFGTDIEEGAYKNAIQNIERNNVNNFQVELGDVEVIPKVTYDLIIANINKNVLKRHLPVYASLAESKSTLMLSGFFESDVDELKAEAKKCNFRLIEVLTLDNWAVMLLIKD